MQFGTEYKTSCRINPAQFFMRRFTVLYWPLLVGFLGSGAVYPGQMCGSQTSPLDVHFLLGPRGSTVSGRQIQPKTIASTSNVPSVGTA